MWSKVWDISTVSVSFIVISNWRMFWFDLSDSSSLTLSLSLISSSTKGTVHGSQILASVNPKWWWVVPWWEVSARRDFESLIDMLVSQHRFIWLRSCSHRNMITPSMSTLSEFCFGISVRTEWNYRRILMFAHRKTFFGQQWRKGFDPNVWWILVMNVGRLWPNVGILNRLSDLILVKSKRRSNKSSTEQATRDRCFFSACLFTSFRWVIE